MGKTSTAPEQPKTVFPWYLLIVGLSDASALNPGSAKLSPFVFASRNKYLPS
jgi:hypothetical protein